MPRSHLAVHTSVGTDCSAKLAAASSPIPQSLHITHSRKSMGEDGKARRRVPQRPAVLSALSSLASSPIAAVSPIAQSLPNDREGAVRLPPILPTVYRSKRALDQYSMIQYPSAERTKPAASDQQGGAIYVSVASFCVVAH